MLTVIGLTVAGLLGGAIVTETVFALPGVGNLVVSAVLRRDYPVIQGALLVISGVYVLINLGIDILYAVLDPRVRYDATLRYRKSPRDRFRQYCCCSVNSFGDGLC